MVGCFPREGNVLRAAPHTRLPALLAAVLCAVFLVVDFCGGFVGRFFVFFFGVSVLSFGQHQRFFLCFFVILALMLFF